MIDIELSVNGLMVREAVEPRLLLTDFLRHRLGLTGTHVGCEHGICGACTVLLDGLPHREPVDGELDVDHRARSIARRTSVPVSERR